MELDLMTEFENLVRRTHEYSSSSISSARTSSHPDPCVQNARQGRRLATTRSWIRVDSDEKLALEQDPHLMIPPRGMPARSRSALARHSGQIQKAPSS
jgi:hypothetical protein